MSLLDRFRAGTELDSVGHFTLDEKRAKSKMANFQLVQTEDFLLLVTQALIAAGCRSMEIDVEGPDIRVEAGGVNLDPEKLKRLEEYLFDTSRDSTSYYLLEIACNAVGSLCREEPEISLDGSVFQFKARLDQPLPGAVERLQRQLRHVAIPVTLNRQPLPSQPVREKEPLITLTLGRGLQLTIVRYGVVVSEKTLPSALGTVAVVCDNDVRLDASFSDVVEDETFRALLERVAEEADRTIIRLARGYAPGSSDGPRLLRYLTENLSKPVGKALRECPLFALADRDQQVSFSELAPCETVLYSDRRLNVQLDDLVVLMPNRQLSLFRSIFGERLQDAGPAYRRKQELLRNKRRWEESPRPTTLAPNEYLSREKLEGPGWQAEIGYLAPPGGECHVDILYQGRLLSTERLDRTAPGATAVLNLEDVEINDTWSHPVGRKFRAAMKVVKTRLEALFDGMKLERSQLYPDLEAYLYELLQRRNFNPPLVARSAPVFESVDGKWFSLQQLMSRERVSIGVEWAPPEGVPPDQIPRELLKPVPNLEIILRLHVGDYTDFRPLQSHLTRLAPRLASSDGPASVAMPPLSRALKQEGVQGVFGLYPESYVNDVECVFFLKGAILETFIQKLTRVVRGKIALRCGSLTPDKGWTGFERDAAFKKLINVTRREIQSFEQSLLDHPETSSELFMRLLCAYSKPLSEYRQRKLFHSTRPGLLHTLEELENEILEQGCLLSGETGMELPDRIVLRSDISYKKLREVVLLSALGEFAWAEAAPIIEERRLAAGFRARPVESRVEVRTWADFRYPLSQCSGEVVVGLVDPDLSRTVGCYFEGRFVCRKKYLLPSGCAAVISSNTLELNRSYDDAKIPQAIWDEVNSLVEKGLLECLSTDTPHPYALGIEYALSPLPSKSFMQAAGELPLFRSQNGERLSARDLEGLDTAPTYVRTQFPLDIEADRFTLRLDKDQLKLLKTRFKIDPTQVEKALLRADRDRRYLNGLPTELPSSATFVREYGHDEIRVRLAICYGESSAVGFDLEGNPLGYLKLPGLPVTALIWGAAKGSRNSDDYPTSMLAKSDRRRVRDWLDSLYVEWAEELSRRALDDREKQHALRILANTKHELGSHQEHPQARVANRLWRIPLFPRVDGTRVSGRSLAEAVQANQQPVLLAESRRRAPSEALLVAPNSREYSVLRNVFGVNGLQWYEAPPLIDPEKFRAGFKRLVDWGIAPLKAAQEKLSQLSREEEPKAPARKKAAAKKAVTTKKKRKPEQPKTSPETVFLDQMKSEVATLLGRTYTQRRTHAFSTTEIGSWVFGPPVYETTNQRFCFNSAHPGIRWLIHSNPDPRSDTRRVCMALLLIHWVSLVNDAREAFDDEDERAFLTTLSQRMAHTFG